MKSCLVVDDSRVIRMVARKILEKLNFEVIEAEDGQVAIDVCKSKLPDSVLLDWNMCSAPGSLDTSLSHAAGLIEIAACHA